MKLLLTLFVLAVMFAVYGALLLPGRDRWPRRHLLRDMARHNPRFLL